jgi:hypothetical protein
MLNKDKCFLYQIEGKFHALGLDPQLFYPHSVSAEAVVKKCFHYHSVLQEQLKIPQVL